MCAGQLEMIIQCQRVLTCGGGGGIVHPHSEKQYNDKIEGEGRKPPQACDTKREVVRFVGGGEEVEAP